MPPLAYEAYGNGRFGFLVDVPVFFVASPPPTNGDGQEWTWGAHAQLTAWGMYNSASLPVDCTSHKGNSRQARDRGRLLDHRQGLREDLLGEDGSRCWCALRSFA